MQLVSGTSAGLPAGLYSRVSRYRHEVFVQRLAWNLQTPDGEEIDQFDREDTVYVVAQDAAGQIAGCGRLLPTTRPYLLGDVFAQLLNGAPPLQPGNLGAVALLRRGFERQAFRTLEPDGLTRGN